MPPLRKHSLTGTCMAMYHSNCRLPSPLRKLKVQDGDEKEGSLPNIKGSPSKWSLESCAWEQTFIRWCWSPNVIWFVIKAWKWWQRPKIGDVKGDCTVLHFSISSFRATKWGWYSGWMSFAVTAVVFPHKGGPSNGLRSVCNRRGGTKQGSLLRVHSHISEGQNHYGTRVSFKMAPTLFCHPNPRLC